MPAPPNLLPTKVTHPLSIARQVLIFASVGTVLSVANG